MKKYSLPFFILFVVFGLRHASSVYAVNCENVPISGNYTLAVTGQSSCTFSGTTIDGVDSGTGSSNTAVLTIPATISLSILNGQTIAAGSIAITTGGSVTIVSGGTFKPGAAIYVTDSDGDGYADISGSQSLSGTTRRNSVTATTDCSDSAANAKPGQTNYYTTTFNNINPSCPNATSYDWDCDCNEDEKQYTDLYTCTACTNGSTHASYKAAYQSGTGGTGGWLTSVPGCGATATYYVIGRSPTDYYDVCVDPAVANCSTMTTNSQVTQGCR